MRCLPMLVHLSFICCLSHSHISKIKQDRPTVTMECYIEVGTGDFVATFRSPHTLLGRYRGLKLKNWVQILILLFKHDRRYITGAVN